MGGPGLLERSTYDIGEPRVPVTCVTVAQASAFCAWRGGALPTAAQWTLAARGANVQRYAWGSAPATCTEHPESLEDPSSAACVPAEGQTPITLHVVGAHRKGASPSGMEDVLLGKGELLASDPDAQFPACAPPYRGCVVYGSRPGAIDTYEAVTPGGVGAGAEEEKVSIAATFRCAFEEESK
jgi:formylglycine-generating enzyme required for sulfatase activity